MGFISIPNPFKAIGNAVKDIATKAVDAVSTYVAKGIGKVMHDALVRLGIPGPLATLVAMAFDPRYAKSEIMEAIQEVGEKLGVPQGVLDKLKNIVNKIDDYAKTFATQGFGGVVKQLGKDLGLPPALYTAIAIAVDVGTGNYAGAAMSAVELASIAAKELGIPADALDVVALGTAIAKGDVNGIQKYGAEVASDLVEHIPGMPEELKNGLQAGLQFAGGNTEKAQAELGQLLNNVLEDLPLPDEIKTLGKIGAAYYTGDKAALEKASMELAREIVGHLDLPPAAQKIFDTGMALYEGDTAKAAAILGVPVELVNGAIDVAKNKDQYLAELRKVASDPAARKAFTDKLVNTAVEKGPAFVAQQLGIDPKYVDMAKTAYNIGSDVYQNRDAYMALAKDIATNPEVRKEFTQIFVGETLTRLGVTPEQQKLAQQFLKDPMGTLDANKEAIARAALNKAGVSNQQIDAAKKFLDNPEAAIKAGGDALVREAKAGLAKLGITDKTFATIESFAKDPGGTAKKLAGDYARQLGGELGVPPKVVDDLLNGDTKSAVQMGKDAARDAANDLLPKFIRV
jgi:butyrate kinase